MPMQALRGGVAAGLALSALVAVAQPVVIYSRSPATFEAVRDDLKTAIEGRGLVIDYQAQIARMLERTGPDVGSARPIYADAQTLQFCSAQLSRKAMEAHPANVVMCPYAIAVWATAAKPDEVFVAYRRTAMSGRGPNSRVALREVDALLDSLAREAVGRK